MASMLNARSSLSDAQNLLLRLILYFQQPWVLALLRERRWPRSDTKHTDGTASKHSAAPLACAVRSLIGLVCCFVCLFSLVLQAVDKEKLEISVKEKLQAVAEAAKALAAQYAQRNSAGETITLTAAQMAPTTLEVIEKNGIPLKLDGASKQESRLKSAVMISGALAVRQQIATAVIADIKHEMELQKLPAGLIKKAEEKLPALLAKALESQIVGMANKAGKGEPLISPEDERKIADYKAKKAAAAAEESKKLRGAFSIKTAHGTWVCAHPDGSITGAPHVKEWERYEVDTVPGGLANTVKIKGAHGQFLSVDAQFKVTVSKREAGPSESFDVHVIHSSATGFTAHLECHQTHKFLSAQPGGHLEGNRDKAAEWEVFTFTRI